MFVPTHGAEGDVGCVEAKRVPGLGGLGGEVITVEAKAAAALFCFRSCFFDVLFVCISR